MLSVPGLRASRTAVAEPRLIDLNHVFFSFLGCVCGEWLADLCWAEERGPVGETQGGGGGVVMEEVV